MPLSLKSLSIGWLGGTGLVIVGGGGYLIYDFVNPIGSQWLLDSGYILNPPQFASHKNKDYGCTENIFKEDQGFNENTTYACRVAGLSISNDGDQIKGASIDYLTFSSEYVLRKGKQGWKKLLKFDNRSGPIVNIQITRYENKDNEWKEGKSWYVAQKLKTSAYQKQLIQARKSNAAHTISSEIKDFWITLHGFEWYNGQDIYEKNASWKSSSASIQMQQLSQVWKEEKQGSWIWVEDAGGKKLNELTSETVLNATQKEWASCFLLKDFFPWIPRERTCQNDKKSVWGHAYMIISSLEEKTIGKWLSTEEFCGLANKRKWSINEAQRTKLKIYCSKPKSEDQFLEISNQSSA